MKKSYFFLIFLIVILPSCVSKYENSMLKDANLRGSVKSIEETYPKIKAQEIQPGSIKIVGEIVSLDRMEKALDSDKSALQVISEKYGFPARAIVSMKDVIEALYVPGGIITEEIKEKLDGYYAQYGAR